MWGWKWPGELEPILSVARRTHKKPSVLLLLGLEPPAPAFGLGLGIVQMWSGRGALMASLGVTGAGTEEIKEAPNCLVRLFPVWAVGILISARPISHKVALLDREHCLPTLSDNVIPCFRNF